MRTVAAALALFGLAAAACGGDDESSSDSATTAPPSSGDTTTTTTGEEDPLSAIGINLDDCGGSYNPVEGVTDTEIKIGNTHAYSGPASAYATNAKTEAAYFKMINDQGGIAGRKLNFISYDDSASPPKAIEQVRRLVEQDEVVAR